jgi:hypothetical protein
MIINSQLLNILIWCRMAILVLNLVALQEKQLKMRLQILSHFKTRDSKCDSTVQEHPGFEKKTKIREKVHPKTTSTNSRDDRSGRQR